MSIMQYALQAYVFWTHNTSYNYLLQVRICLRASLHDAMGSMVIWSQCHACLGLGSSFLILTFTDKL